MKHWTIAVVLAATSPILADGNDPMTTRSLPDLPKGLTSFGAARLDGTVYVYGGHTGTAHDYYREGQSDELLALDLSNPKAWKVVGKVPRRQGLALVAHGGYLYRVGGFEAKNAEGEKAELVSTTDFARFDPKTKKWESLAALPEPRSSHDAVVIGDRLYVVGGWEMEKGDEPEWHAAALVADLSADEIRWQRLPDPPFLRRALALGEADGRLYVIGGMQRGGGPTTKVAVFDPKTEKWTPGPAVLAENDMGGFGASAFRCGDDLFVSTYEGSVQRLDENAGKWVEVTKLENPRFFHRMLPLADGKLVVIGGASMRTGKVVETETIDVAD